MNPPVEALHTSSDFIPIAISFVVAVGFVAGGMVATHLLGPRRRSAAKDQAFECGIPGQGNARIPFSIKYFLVAILFVIFDVEIIFMYPWAVNFRELGWMGLAEMGLFLAFVLSGFVYMVRRGALKWE
ncbi:MAG: NADH-quinone oxidoreductase subunit A [Spirochaetes bacterium]|nr:NADH-quinone oxidoreductase subunit A [Spirochaetota bacterium]